MAIPSYGLAFAALLTSVGLEQAPAAPATGASAYDVGRTDPLRHRLLDVLRPHVERDLGQKVIFVVDVLRVQDGWAFATLLPRAPDGAPVDFSRTRHAERLREGMLDGDTLYALLRRDGPTWKVVTFIIGPTDVAWADWSAAYGAPESLFALPAGDR